MKSKHPLWLRRLAAMGACREALAWACRWRFASWQACWDACRNPMWMTWVYDQLTDRYCVPRATRDSVWDARLNGRYWSGAAAADRVRAAFPRAPRLPPLRGGR